MHKKLEPTYCNGNNEELSPVPDKKILAITRYRDGDCFASKIY